MTRLLSFILLLALSFYAVAEESLANDPVPADDILVIESSVESGAPGEIELPGELSIPEAFGPDALNPELADALPDPPHDAPVANGLMDEIRIRSWEELQTVAGKDKAVRITLDSDVICINKISVRKFVILELHRRFLSGKQHDISMIEVKDDAYLNVLNGTMRDAASALIISNAGEATISLVTIQDFSSSGVDNKGSFTMTDRSQITRTKTGVSNSGSFTMTGGSFTDNKTGVFNTGSFTMTGGSIAGNGKGVTAGPSADTVLTVSGNVNITGNSECDVLLQAGQTVEVGGPLDPASRIGITLDPGNLPGPGSPVVVTHGLKGNGAADNFVVWGDYETRVNADGELEVALTPPSALPPAPDYTLLARLSTSGSCALKLGWTPVEGALGYDVFFGRAEDPRGKVASTTGAACKLTKLKAGATYRACVRAWTREGGQKVYIGQPSPTVYAIAGGHSRTHCNPKSISVNKRQITLKPGSTAKIRATVKGSRHDMKLLHQTRRVRYYSSDANVAQVNAEGKIKALAPGACTIYAITNNGLNAPVSVTVQ